MGILMDIEKGTKVAEILSKLFKEKGVSPNEFARKTALPHNTVYMILSGKVKVPNGATLIIFADYFGVTIDYLLGREVDKAPSSSDGFKQAIKMIPFIKWQEINKWQKSKGISYDGLEKRSLEYYTLATTTRAFALPVNRDYLKEVFLEDSIIIIDPIEIIRDGDFILVEESYTKKAIWKLKEFNGKKYINPIGIKEDAIELDKRFKILGKVVENRKHYNRSLDFQFVEN